MDEFSQKFAVDCIQFLDQPLCRPSMSNENGRNVAVRYGQLFEVLEQLASGKLHIVNVPEVVESETGEVK